MSGVTQLSRALVARLTLRRAAKGPPPFQDRCETWPKSLYLAVMVVEARLDDLGARAASSPTAGP